MEEAKPKRKYVMTPEHRAKVIANLGKARQAPKEKVYRKTEKRYRANVNNLGIANAKRRQEAEQEAETLRSKMESLFPAPEVPAPPILFFPESFPELYPGNFIDPPPPLPPEQNAFEEATRLIGERLRKVRAGVRREGRRIMRVLTAALKRSGPLSLERAMILVADLMRCLDTSRLTKEARRLNEKIEHLLGKMIEQRYGPEAQVEGFPLHTYVDMVLCEQAAERGAQREARRERAAKQASDQEAGDSGPEEEPGSGFGGSGFAEGTGQDSGSASPDSRAPSPGSSAKGAATLPFPKTKEELGRLLARALDLEDNPRLAQGLAETIWERVHEWQRRHEDEACEMEQLFREAALHPPGFYPDRNQELRSRAYGIPAILDLNKEFRKRMDALTKQVKEDLEYWVDMVPQRELRSAKRTENPPGKPPIPSSDAGSGGTSAVA